MYMEVETKPTIWDRKIEVLLGTLKQHFGNDGNRQRTKEYPLPKTQEKKLRTLNFLIGCMKFLFPKLFATIFNLG
jgi:hypothetical protein